MSKSDVRPVSHLSSPSAGHRTLMAATSGKLHARTQHSLAQVHSRLGYPPQLTAAFSGEEWEGGTAGTSLDAARFGKMQAAGQPIACTGFDAIPIPLVAVLPVPAPYIGDGTYMERQLKRARRVRGPALLPTCHGLTNCLRGFLEAGTTLTPRSLVSPLSRARPAALTGCATRGWTRPQMSTSSAGSPPCARETRSRRCPCAVGCAGGHCSASTVDTDIPGMLKSTASVWLSCES